MQQLENCCINYVRLSNLLNHPFVQIYRKQPIISFKFSLKQNRNNMSRFTDMSLFIFYLVALLHRRVAMHRSCISKQEYCINLP